MPALPLPRSLTEEPLSTPFGIFTLTVSVAKVLPMPEQLVQMRVVFLPLPPQAEHLSATRKKPFATWVLPMPLHTGQGSLSSTPVAPQEEQGISFLYVMRFVTPSNASRRETSTFVAMSEPLRKAACGPLTPAPGCPGLGLALRLVLAQVALEQADRLGGLIYGLLRAEIRDR